LTLPVTDEVTVSEVPVVAVISGMVTTISLFLLYSMLSSPSEQAMKVKTVSRDIKKNVSFFIGSVSF
jgi:hypothetical protein